MKIVDRKTFLAMPSEVLFAKYAPCYFEALMIKGDTISHDGSDIDFFYQDIVSAIKSTGSDDWTNKLFHSAATSGNLAMDFDCQGRDGCFEADQLFAVFEPQDVVALIARLQRTITDKVRPC